MKTFVYSTHSYEKPYLLKAADTNHELSFTHEKLSLDTVQYAIGNKAVSIFTSDDCSGPVLEKLYAHGVRYVALRSVGFDHADIEKANSLGIQVANVPEYSPYAVAEHAVAMLMTLNRKFVESRLLMQLQDFRLDNLTGVDVHGKIVGIIGTGKIGMAFAQIMKGFGTTILACDPVENPEAFSVGIKYVGLDELLMTCDIISIHCPLNTNTRHLLSNAQFSRMKKGCMLINTSRGAIINTSDLIEAIEKDHLRGVCLDVFENEKNLFFEDHRTHVLRDEQFMKLRSFQNVLITGHQAFLTAEALSGIAATTMLNLEHWQRGDRSPNDLQLHKPVEVVASA